MSKIKIIKGREILDSRGNPTVEVDVILNNGSFGRAAVPSGASTGTHEVVEKRDVNENRYLGKGVLEAVENVNGIIFDSLKNKDCLDQKLLDEILIDTDGTEKKSNIGGNAILGASLACARAAAASLDIPLFKYIGNDDSVRLPVPFMNILNGGAHADNNLDFQEFMIVPVGAKSFSESIRCGAEIFSILKNILIEKKLNISVGDEGGFAPDLVCTRQALDLLTQATEKAGYIMGKEVYFALDVASTEFYSSGLYELKGEEKKFDSEGLIEFLQNLCSEYPIISIEDALSEDDWDGWKKITDILGKSTQLVGDDLFVTNKDRLEKGVRQNIANAILIKPNQVGTLTETIETINFANDNNYSSMISHRSGETEDTFISDLSVAFNTGQIKTGSLSRSDRLAKYNQLIRIEEFLGKKAIYDGNLLHRFLD